MKNAKRSICVSLALATILGTSAYAADFSSIDTSNLTYDKDVDYSELLVARCEAGSEEDLYKAAEYEYQRNLKIEDLDLDYNQTKFFELLEDADEIIDAVLLYAETGNIYGVSKFSVDATSLNCRKEATIESARAGAFTNGSVLTYLKQDTDYDGYVWYQVTDGSTTGWCRADYLKEHTGSETATTAKAVESETEVEVSESSNYSEDDLYWLAAAITKEAGSNWITDEHQLMVGNVILNRVESSAFPNTIHEVLTQKGQYPWASKGTQVTPTERAYSNAEKLLNGERVLPSDVVYQGTVTQGSGVYTSVYDATLGNTTYFCYY